MKYQVTHTTHYAYGSAVDLSYQMLRLRPRDETWQRVEDFKIAVTPEPTARDQHQDHFGNAVDFVALQTPHDAFTVTASSRVEVSRDAPTGGGPAWESVRDALEGDGFPRWPQAAEFTYPSPLVPVREAVAALARRHFTPGRPIAAAARALTAAIKRDFTYLPGATTIATPIEDVVERRQGVCQDFAHVMIGALRGIGLAARYVSGYIRTYRPEEHADWRGADASHAWVSVWCGEDMGWVEFDPTNDLVVADEHVVVAYGRDFSDVSPLRGILLGGGRHLLSVAVTLTPLGEDE